MDAPTQIMLRIHNTDDDLRAKMTGLRVTLAVRKGSGWSERKPLDLASKGLKWPVEIPITPSTPANASKQIEVVVDALAKGRVLAQTRALADFVRDERRVLEVHLFVCPGHTADEGYVCAADGCLHEACEVCNAKGDCEAVAEAPTVEMPQDAGSEQPPNKEPPDPDAGSADDAGDGSAGNDDGGGGKGGKSGSNSDDKGDGEEPLIPEPTDVAIHELGEACATARERACPEHDSKDKLVCMDGEWIAGGSCDGNTRCDTQLGTTQGTCQDIAEPCVGQEPGAGVCGDRELQRCDADLLRYESIACPADAHCVETGDTVDCACDTGFHNDGDQMCSDDDCTGNTCGEGGECVEGVGDYTCECQSGFDGDGSKMCEDVDECDDGVATACGAGAAKCENTPGNYDCTCSGGYTLDGAHACKDIDECQETNVCTAEFPCRNLTPNYTCRGHMVDWIPLDSPNTFTVASNGTVTDSRNGLVWQGSINDTLYNWTNAKSHCAAPNLPGSGWRLPTVAELESIVDYGSRSPAIDTAIFETAAERYWTSSEMVRQDGVAHSVDFGDGGSYGDYTTTALRVRCVR